MPYAKIMTTQAMGTLRQLHGELAGKITANKSEADRLRSCMIQVEAVMKMLDPKADLRSIAVHRKQRNPWFKRGTIFRTAIDVLRDAPEPMKAADIAKTMLDRKGIKDPDRDRFREFISAVHPAAT